MIDGVPAPVTVETDPATQQISVSGGGITLTASTEGQNGQTLPLAPDGSLLVPQDGAIPMSGSGFASGSEVGLFLFSDPINLGTVTANTSGTATATAQIPGTVPTGSHTLQIAGTNSSGQTIALSMGITITTPPVITLDAGPRTKAGRHDRITVTGTVTAIPAGAVLTPYIKFQGPNGYRPGTAKITVAPDGTYTWTRSVPTDRRVSVYLTYPGTQSTPVTWRRIR